MLCSLYYIYLLHKLVNAFRDTKNSIMDLQLSSFHVILTFSLFVVMVLKIASRGKTKGSGSNLPPGPRELPFIGNIHQLAGSLPHRSLRNLAKKYGPLMHLRLGEVSTVVVSSAEFAREVMKTHDVIFASRPHLLAADIVSYNSTNIVFAKYGDYWRQLRKICTFEVLSAKRVQSYRPIREEEMQNLVEWIASKAKSPINLTEKIHSSTYSITSRAAFGKKSKYHEEFIAVVKEGIQLAGGFDLADVFPSYSLLHMLTGMRPKLERMHKKTDRILEYIIKEHTDKATSKGGEKEAQEHLVEVLLKFHEDNGGLEFTLTTDNIKAVILDIFGAGSETSATTVDWAMSEMVKNPQIMKRAQDEVREVFNRLGQVSETGIKEMKYLNSIIKETLRLHPPAPLLIPKECRETCVVGGYEIPVKTKVVVNGWAIGRDPKYWTEPESFYPERFLDSTIDFRGTNFEFIPFGAGRRMCPGITYGMANVELPLAMLLYHFDWELPNGMKHEDLDMTEAFGITVRRKEDLCLIPTLYHPPPTEQTQV
ncbi:cytochrome P450 71D11-like [Argentina anserina]|uniref:cytochrome P450 71D11-like n=1 Tax=Argentina anserina TaxID=57926 RepID=UPI002176656B|nr:cytochrome P450 71D11-like [Potentilla anserina]